MARSFANERWGEAGFYMEQSDHEDESLSLCDLPINLFKDEKNPHFLFQKKPGAVEKPIAAGEFDFGSSRVFGNSVAPEMCMADEVFYQGKILPVRLSVSSDNSSAGFYRRHDSIGKLRSINSSGSSSSSSSVTNDSITSTSAARNSRPRVPNLFHSHPSPKPQIKASPTTFRQASTGGRSQKSSSTWDFFRVGIVKAPGMELQDLKHRSSTRRNSSAGSRSDSTINNGGSSEKETMRRPRARVSIERKSGGILSGVGCKCSVESAVAERRRRKGNSKNIPAQAMAVAVAIREKAMKELEKKKIEKEKEQQEKLAMARDRTFEWLKELSHATLDPTHASNSSL